MRHEHDDCRRFHRERGMNGPGRTIAPEMGGEGRGRGRGRSFGRGHGHGGGRGGRRRLFDHGELRLVVLALIAEQPRHGYEIIREIEDRVAGAYAPSPGVVYPTLTMLEEIGHASVEEAEGKKRYAATPEGGAHLEENRAAVDAALARMRAVAATQSGGRAPEIVRAWENLKLAYRLRLERGALSPEETQAIAAALDAAAVAIERS
ncbi:MAG: PadR family transcriptional regulator [Alphaproteobacteria bacterium]